MAIEKALTKTVVKPWGARDLQPWSNFKCGEEAIGEIWFERSNKTAALPHLLIKLIFAQDILSVQVHPDDVLARKLGLPNGKTEAWYVLSAGPHAHVGVGLKQAVTWSELRIAIGDGSIVDLMDWQEVHSGSSVFVPAGTIHAIGANIVLAEIQQRSDTTFRLFDFDRRRQLDVEDGLAAALIEPAKLMQTNPIRRPGLEILVSCSHFELELVELTAGAILGLDAERETWFLVLEGSLTLGSLTAVRGEALFLEDEVAVISAGHHGLKGLCARATAQPEMGSHNIDRDAAGELSARESENVSVQSSSPGSRSNQLCVVQS